MRCGVQSFIIAAALIGIVTTVLAQNSVQDYPQWRGCLRDGAASGFKEPKAWPEKLTRIWKVEVGEGYATPIVIGKTVYAFTRRDGAETMTALDATTGKRIWRTGYPAPYKPADAAAVHGAGPKATPLFQNGKLYTVGISGIVSAFDAVTGKLLWQKPAPAEHPYFGMAASPIAEKEMVILNPGNYGPLTAYDASTGVVKWTANGNGVYASPIIVELGGVRQIVSMTNKSVVGVGVTDGVTLWEHKWEPAGIDSAITPIVYGETIIVASQRDPVTALKPILRDGKWQVEVLWENKEVSLFMSNPVLIGDTLFGLSEKSGGQFFGLDAKTGKTLWLGRPREASNTAFVKAG
ncbi:MAG: PQQ-like beta-propeller repeat protein, partial [Blastocatellia bacterium]|nr:PQQ-like beta-propeller repeat protein [Blastocatellia bacterium]